MPAQTIKREMARLRKELLIIGSTLGLILIVVVLIVGWAGDHRSCLRSVPLRASVIEQREINKQAIPYWESVGRPEVAARLRQRVQADRDVTQLDCSGLFPGT